MRLPFSGARLPICFTYSTLNSLFGRDADEHVSIPVHYPELLADLVTIRIASRRPAFSKERSRFERRIRMALTFSLICRADRMSRTSRTELHLTSSGAPSASSESLRSLMNAGSAPREHDCRHCLRMHGETSECADHCPCAGHRNTLAKVSWHTSSMAWED